MARKKGGKSTKKKTPKLLDPLPGPELLRPVLTYSEDDPALQPGPTKTGTHYNAFQPPPPEEDEEPGDGSSLGNVPPDLIFDLENRPDFDELHALKLAEDNGDDIRTPSSATEDFYETPPKSELSVGSAETQSESTGSDTDLEGYDIHEISDVKSLEDLDKEESNFFFAEPYGGGSLRQNTAHKTQRESSGRANVPVSKSLEDWITEKFADILQPTLNHAGPLYLTVDDLLETNLDFTRMGPEVIARLKKVAERSSTPDLTEQISDDFESPSASIRSSSVDSHIILLENNRKNILPPPPVDTNGDKGMTKKTGKTVKAASPKNLLPFKDIPVPKPRKRFSAETYEERLRKQRIEKPFVHRHEVRGTNEEQDAWVTESAEDLTFIENRREEILSGKGDPLMGTDQELEFVAEIIASKQIGFLSAFDNSIGITKENTDDTLPPVVEDEDELPPKPLVPIKVNPAEDPDDEDTTSEEDQLSDSEKKKAQASIPAKLVAAVVSVPPGSEKTIVNPRQSTDPFRLPVPVHEDDQHDYYESDRSSSECESLEGVIRSDIAKQIEKLDKIRQNNPESKKLWTSPPVVVAGRFHELTLPIDDDKLTNLSFNVEDLYALAHDLRMPPSELRKELFAPTAEMDFEQDPDEEGWKHVQAIFEYEKNPAFYAVQIKDLQEKIHYRREQWITLELDHHELTFKSKTELTKLEMFITFLMEQKTRDAKRVADLKNDQEKLNQQLDKMIQYQTPTTNWLLQQKEKLKEDAENRKTALQFKLYALREYVDKQRRMEFRIAILKKQATQAKASYTQKVSKMMLQSARQRNRLFRDYERKIGLVFIEYQRALMLSMNDNLQAACCEHVISRERAKKFSDRAIQSLKEFQKASDKLDSSENMVEMEEELFHVSKTQAERVHRRYQRLRKLFDHEDEKLQQLDSAISTNERAEAKRHKWKKLAKDNAILDKITEDLKNECKNLTSHLKKQRIVNEQMENHLRKLLSDTEAYFRYQRSGEQKSSKRYLIDSFEDRFIKFLQFAKNIENLSLGKKNQYLFSEGEFGLVPTRPKIKHGNHSK